MFLRFRAISLRLHVKLDPQTPVDGLLRAIPSSAIVFERFGISADPSEKRTLQEVCTDQGIRVEEFLGAMDEIDWNGESPEELAI